VSRLLLRCEPSELQVTANAAGGLLLLTLVVTSGFAIIRTDIPP
jgi:hypothetical protein